MLSSTGGEGLHFDRQSLAEIAVTGYPASCLLPLCLGPALAAAAALTSAVNAEADGKSLPSEWRGSQRRQKHLAQISASGVASSGRGTVGTFDCCSRFEQ